MLSAVDYTLLSLPVTASGSQLAVSVNVYCLSNKVATVYVDSISIA